ncbi:TIGR03915 family putative DNA repair protein [Dysosmobacter sp. Marseille-Q4140]|nr:TIGR03915 family putative DNA repair protein [Dysosmobacter sp. Marseille-Q4140]
MTEMIYEYDGSFEGFLCCVFESYAQKEVLTAIVGGEDPAITLFPVRTVETDPAHAARVLRRIAKCSPEALDLLRRGFLTCLPDREMHLYRMVRRLLEEGPGFLRDLADPELPPLRQAVRHLASEAHLLKGFVRFSELGGVLGGEIAPKNRVLPLLRCHFCARYREEKFFLYDRTHHEVLLYAAGRAEIRPLAHFRMAPPEEAEARYRLLWKRFYDTVAIRERYNPRCRRTQMPQRYWGTMTEFQGPEHFTARSSPAAVSAPGAPAGIPAPGTPPGSGPSGPGSAP